MSMYEISYKITGNDVDMYKRLRISRLFTLFQEIAVAHAEMLGAWRDKTLDRGLLWVVTLQNAEIARMPMYDEQLRFVTWAGKVMHAFFPRYAEVIDANGEVLVRATALWVLMDANTRKMVQPKDAGLLLPGEVTGREGAFPRVPKAPEEGETADFTVPYSYVDINGHMNNTRYFDLAEDLAPEEVRSRKLLSIGVEYAGEIRLGDRICVRTAWESGHFRVQGLNQDKNCFRIDLNYGD